MILALDTLSMNPRPYFYGRNGAVMFSYWRESDSRWINVPSGFVDMTDVRNTLPRVSFIEILHDDGEG